jgi:hypothetical protein
MLAARDSTSGAGWSQPTTPPHGSAGPLTTLPPTSIPEPAAASAVPVVQPPPLLPVEITDPGNLEHRLERLEESFKDLPASPLIGLGANSFGQRHLDPSQSLQPDYLAMLPFTVLYDAGLVGLAGFGLFVAATAWRLLRWRRRSLGAAFLAAAAILLASYVMTDAHRFAWNWLLIGSALGLLAATDRGGPQPEGAAE